MADKMLISHIKLSNYSISISIIQLVQVQYRHETLESDIGEDMRKAKTVLRYEMMCDMKMCETTSLNKKTKSKHTTSFSHTPEFLPLLKWLPNDAFASTIQLGINQILGLRALRLSAEAHHDLCETLLSWEAYSSNGRWTKGIKVR